MAQLQFKLQILNTTFTIRMVRRVRQIISDVNSDLRDDDDDDSLMRVSTLLTVILRVIVMLE